MVIRLLLGIATGLVLGVAGTAAVYTLWDGTERERTGLLDRNRLERAIYDRNATRVHCVEKEGSERMFICMASDEFAVLEITVSKDARSWSISRVIGS